MRQRFLKELKVLCAMLGASLLMITAASCSDTNEQTASGYGEIFVSENLETRGENSEAYEAQGDSIENSDEQSTETPSAEQKAENKQEDSRAVSSKAPASAGKEVSKAATSTSTASKAASSKSASSKSTSSKAAPKTASSKAASSKTSSCDFTFSVIQPPKTTSSKAASSKVTSYPAASSKATSSKAASSKVTSQAPVNSSIESYQAEVIRLTNIERRNAGLPELKTGDARVQAAADIRAAEIVKSFSHTRPDGTSTFTALTQQGVQYRAAGENIAYGQTSPAQVVQGWMNSSGHRANILNSNFDTICIGHVVSGSRHYWVQIFVRL